MTEITTEDLTTKSVDGTGVFDELMSATSAHLDDQFKSNRIKGTDYANVYLGSLQAVLQQSIQFLLSKDDVAAKIALTNAQTKLTEAELLNVPKQGVLLEAQASLAQAEALNIPKQGKLIEAQILLANRQADIALLDADIKAKELLIKQKELDIATANLVNIPKEGAVLDAQAADILAKTKIAKDNVRLDDLRKEEEINSLQNKTTNSLYERFNIQKQNDVLAGQADKLDADKCLAKQKFYTEIAQLSDSFPYTNPDTGERVTVTNITGVVGKQKSVYAKQIAGFDRDAEWKMAKIMSDNWTARFSVTDGDGMSSRKAGVHDEAVYAAIKKANDGANS